MTRPKIASLFCLNSSHSSCKRVCFGAKGDSNICWVSGIGYWVLVIGYWVLDTGCWILVEFLAPNALRLAPLILVAGYELSYESKVTGHSLSCDSGVFSIVNSQYSIFNFTVVFSDLQRDRGDLK